MEGRICEMQAINRSPEATVQLGGGGYGVLCLATRYSLFFRGICNAGTRLSMLFGAHLAPVPVTRMGTQLAPYDSLLMPHQHSTDIHVLASGEPTGTIALWYMASGMGCQG